MIGAGVVLLGLVLARVGTFVAVLPLTGGRAIPRFVKAGLAVAFTGVWFGNILEQIPVRFFFQWSGTVTWLEMGMALGREAILGAIMGYAFGMFLLPARMAGEYLTQELGLSFGNMVQPTGETGGGPLPMIFEMVAALIFFGMDGHHVFFTTLDGSFGKYPVGESLPNLPIRELTAMASFSEEWGLMLAAPVGLCLFLTSVSVALMARAAPQLNLYSFGLPLRLGVGLAALVLLLPQGINSLLNFFGQMQTWLAWLV